MDLINTHAPVTTKKVLANNHQFMTKSLKKAIMTRSRLKNAYLKTRNSKDWENYKKQRNICKNLLKKQKANTFNVKSKYKAPKPQQKVLEKIKPFFSDKSLEISNIILKEKANYVLTALLLLIYNYL